MLAYNLTDSNTITNYRLKAYLHYGVFGIPKPLGDAEAFHSGRPAHPFQILVGRRGAS